MPPALPLAPLPASRPHPGPCLAAWLILTCSGCFGALEDPRQGVVLRPSTLRSSEPTLGERFARCVREAHVPGGPPSGEARSGAEAFFFEPLPALARGCRAATAARSASDLAR